MGKTTSNGLKRTHSVKDTDISMAPQKIWSSEAMIPTHLERITSTFDVLVQDMKMKGMDMEFQKIIDDNMHKNMCREDQSDIISSIHDNIILSKTGIKINTEEITSQSPYLIKVCENANIKFKNHYGNLCQAFVLDHSYAIPHDQTQLSPFDDDDIDMCSDITSLSLPEETEPFYHPLSLDCKNSKFGINGDVITSSLDLEKKFTSCSNLLSPSSSISSLASDMVSTKSHSVLTGDDMDDVFSGISSPESASSNPASVHSPGKSVVKNRKFRNDTFSCSALEKFLKCKDNINNNNCNTGIPTDSHQFSSASSSPSAFPNVHSLLPSPSLDWDRSEADSEILDDSSDARTPLRMSPDVIDKVAEWLHPVFHDHDYCIKESISSSGGYGKFKSFSDSSEFGKFTNGKRKYTMKNKLEGVKHEKILSAKYLKKELLRKNQLLNCASELHTETTDLTEIKTNPVGRPKKRPLDKTFDEDIDPETGTKLKITGKFQDQYVYYLPKSSRTTSRGRQATAHPLTSDKIIPALNPGDIVIPHLTDADVEEVRLKGRVALNRTEIPNRSSISSSHVPTQSVNPQSVHVSDIVSDIDSHIVSTILSMENESFTSNTTPHAPDIINTEGLIPNQPALTESLRLMSGDSSITSEHVLNYLLSIVRDDGVLEGGCGSDTSSSFIFPAIPPDSINLKAVHTGETENVMCEGIVSFNKTIDSSHGSRQDVLNVIKLVESTSSFDNHALFSTSQIHEPQKYVNTHMDESVCQPVDLSLFMSESKGTLSSSLVQDEDSHGLMNSTFGCDLESLGPQQSSSIQRLTSIEKTLDYLCLRDENMTIDSSVFDTKMNLDADLSQFTSTFADDTPWVVTVTLYFNDVPAIIINNQPYIRLVDIHKQILPAKDTGILKKRCQLLKIPVLNCTEMQRYFLVQYGRAYNSKSSLIISKDHATDLVTYYATPHSRMGRVSEAQQCRDGRTQNMRSPVTHLPDGRSRRHGGRGSRRVPGSCSLPASDGLGKPPPQLPQQNDTSSEKCEVLATSPGKRTRHKKINYVDMLKGEDNEKYSDAAVMETSEGVLANLRDEKSIKTQEKKKLNSMLSCNKKRDITNRKCASISKKKTNETGSKIVETVQVSKATKVDKDKKISELVSDVIFEDSIDLSPSTKLKPLKLKLKSLLSFARQRKESSSSKRGAFSRSNSTTLSTSDRLLRVLPVVHQTSVHDNSAESHLPSQPADIHLDLFVKPNSACVCCATCSQFLSVPHFMRHHHVPIEGERLATEAAQRVLVPRNKENFSQQEQQLWAEFHRLQEAIGGFGEADDETDDDECDGGGNNNQSSLDLSDCYDAEKALGDLSETAPTSLFNVDKSALDMEAIMKGPIVTGPSSTNRESTSVTESYESQDSVLLGNKLVSDCTLSLNNAHKLSNETVTKPGLMWPDKSSFPGAGLFSGVVDSNTSITRTSTRKRKSKQLFSIENYYTPKRWIVGEELSSQKSV